MYIALWGLFMVVGFFELRLSGIMRFPLWLQPGLAANCPELKTVYFYEQLDCDIDEVISLLPQDSRLVKITKISKRGILELLQHEKLDRLVVMAQRIPDSCLVSAAKSLSIPTIMYQHGLYIPFMKRQGSLFVTNFIKAFRFLKYALVTADIISVSRSWLVVQYIRMFIFGRPFRDIVFPADAVNADTVLVYGNHWKEYHTENFGYSADQQYIVGAPDFVDINGLQGEDMVSNSVCYIAQTLVEDGRLPRRSMLAFISNLSNAVAQSGLHLQIRLHPRSDLSLYDQLPAGTVFSKTEFPKNTVYIGHYSSILAKATFCSNNIILIDFPEHVIPNYISMLAKVRLDYDDQAGLTSELAIAVDNGIDQSEVSVNIDKQNRYFDSSINSPLDTAAIKILNLFEQTKLGAKESC